MWSKKSKMSGRVEVQLLLSRKLIHELFIFSRVLGKCLKGSGCYVRVVVMVSRH